MNKKYVILSVVCLTLGAVLMLSFANANVQSQTSYSPVYDVGQRGVIFYENGSETLILSTSFAGKVDEFAWIVPTPSKPDLGKVSNQLISTLDDRTGQIVGSSGDVYMVPMSGIMSVGTEKYNGPRVQVEDTKEVSYYETKVISANDKNELLNWLKNEGYNFPATDSYLLDDYVSKQWYFTIVRIKPDYAGNTVGQQLSKGKSTPLAFKFATDKIVYPLKLSSVKFERNLAPSTPAYIDGRFGKALQLEKGNFLKGEPQSVDTKQGGISLWVKADSAFFTGQSPELFRVQTAGRDLNTGSLSSGGSRLYASISSGGLYVQSTYASSFSSWTYHNLPWRYNDWNHIVFNWELGEVPEVYVNGIRQSSNSYAQKVQTSRSEDEEFFVGVIPPNNSYQRSKKFAVDELVYQSQPFTASEISAMEGISPSFTEPVLLLAHFNGDMKVTRGPYNQESIFQFLVASSVSSGAYNDPYAYNYQYQTSFPIVLYTIADHRKQAQGFQTEYAGQITKSEIKDLFDSQTDTLLFEPQSNKYILTRLTAQMSRAGIDKDITIENASTDKFVNAPNPNAIWLLWLVLGISIVLTMLFVWLLIRFLRVPRSMAKTGS